MELLGGAFIFLGVVIFLVIALIHGLYTRSGSGINSRPYAQSHGDAPGANRSYRDGLSYLARGTR
jgi:hypothetical protein